MEDMFSYLDLVGLVRRLIGCGLGRTKAEPLGRILGWRDPVCIPGGQLNLVFPVAVS